jgi:tetratricopeptide (TPR) repeat protein
MIGTKVAHYVLLLTLLTGVVTLALSAPAQVGPASGSPERWRAENEAGQIALQQGRPAEAIRAFQAAIAEAEKLGWADQRLAGSISGMAQSYLLQNNYAASERLFQRSLEILEKAVGPEDPAVSLTLNNLATVHRLRGNYAEAVVPARRSLAILEKAYGAEHQNVAIGLNNLALILRMRGDYEEASLLFQRSLSILEKILGREHVNVAIGLNNLVLVQHLQGKDAEAEALARRALSIFEKTPNSGAANLAQSLENLAAICEELGKHDESERLYRRLLSVRWGAPGAKDVVPVLDALSNVLSLAYFNIARQEVSETLQSSKGWDEIGVDLFILMGQHLQGRGLPSEAESVMLRALQSFPRSMMARYELAQVYANSYKWRAALEKYDEASRLDGTGDAALDRFRRSQTHEGIARMQVLLTRFDEAVSSFNMALQIEPANVLARVALGDLYLQMDRTDDAVDEFAKAILQSGGSNAAAYVGLAEASLRLSEFTKAAAAAQQALGVDSGNLKAHYVLAMAQLRSGRIDDGEVSMERFRKLEADERESKDPGGVTGVSLKSAMIKLEKGRIEEALDEIRQNVRSDPGSAVFPLNLGIAQIRVGRHADAVKTLQGMIDRGVGDSFLVDFNLYRAYEALGDRPNSQRYRVSYLRKLDASLKKLR